MKKLLTSKKYKKRILKNQLREKKKLKRNKKYIIIQFLPERISVVSPKVLDIISNPEESLRFIYKLEYHRKKTDRITVNFENLVICHKSGIMLLSVALSGFYFKPTITESKLDSVKEMFRNNDVYSYFSNYKGKDQGSVQERVLKRKFISQSDIESLKRIAAQHTYMNDGIIPLRIETSVQDACAEFIQNTLDHTDKYWYFSLERYPNNISGFLFLDRGKGVFETAKYYRESPEDIFRPIEMMRYFKENKKYKILENVLRRRFIITSKKDKTRGQGLFKIYDGFAKRNYHNLIVISNNAYCNFSNNMMRSLRVQLKGIFVYFEIKPE
ncbi:MAG: hypothetical protein KF690_04595 [Bacteroidetes bacterium]|nr:hypothetical protein [Bacteroidota bacterium]